MSPRSECVLVNGRVMSCDALSETAELGGNGTRYQGLKSISLISTDSGKLSRHCYIIKSGKFSKNGIFINFCPFCGKPALPASESLKTEERP